MYLPEFLNLGAGFSKYFRAVPALDDDLRRTVFGIRHSVYCDELGYEPGQTFDVVKMDGGILLRPAMRKSGRTNAQIVAELRALYKHEGPPVSIEEMNAAVDAMFAAKGKDEI